MGTVAAVCVCSPTPGTLLLTALHAFCCFSPPNIPLSAYTQQRCRFCTSCPRRTAALRNPPSSPAYDECKTTIMLHHPFYFRRLRSVGISRRTKSNWSRRNSVFPLKIHLSEIREKSASRYFGPWVDLDCGKYLFCVQRDV